MHSVHGSRLTENMARKPIRLLRKIPLMEASAASISVGRTSYVSLRTTSNEARKSV